MAQEDLVDLDRSTWTAKCCGTIISGNMQPDTVAESMRRFGDESELSTQEG
jgi:hypothetical protein